MLEPYMYVNILDAVRCRQVSPQRRLQHQGGVAARRVRTLVRRHRLEAVVAKLAGTQTQEDDRKRGAAVSARDVIIHWYVLSCGECV